MDVNAIDANLNLIVAVIHGIGDQAPTFADDFIDRLETELDSAQLGKRIIYVPLYWADITQPRQNAYLARAQKQSVLDYRLLRSFVLSALGDASGYQKVRCGGNQTYQRIHQRIAEQLGQATDLNLPVVIFAHSLGGHIISNYIWDQQQSPNDNFTAVQRMEQLAGLLTFGCNIPLFTFGYDDILPIDVPSNHVQSPLREQVKWLNFYDPDDILGYPLKPINAAYDSVVTEDICLNIGGLLSAWNPLSHQHYWQDNDFIRAGVDYLTDMLTLLSPSD